MIDPNKQYRTRDGRPVRIYATDGEKNAPIHGAIYYPDFGWGIDHWDHNGRNQGPDEMDCCNLIEVTLADELSEQIPWQALRPEITRVAMTSAGDWYGSDRNVHLSTVDGANRWVPLRWTLSGVLMPYVEHGRWKETLCKRPEGR